MRITSGTTAPAQKKATAPTVQQLTITEIDSPAPAQDSTALVLIAGSAPIVPSEFFKPGGSSAILAHYAETIRAEAATLDISTAAGRKSIASLAYEVAKKKTGTDVVRKALVADQKIMLKAIDTEGGRIWEELEALQAEVRKPLTDWEDAEKVRVGNHEAALKLIQEAAVMAAPHTISQVEDRIAYVRHLHDRGWEEFKSRADLLTGQVVSALETTLELAKEAEAQRIELARLRAEAAERAIKEREESAARAAKEAAERRAAEQARIAREAAERERQRIENERIEAEAKAKQAEAEKIAAEERAARELKEAEERRIREAEEAEARRKADAEAAERRRIAVEEESKRRAEEAALKAKMEQERAVEAERQRIAAEQQKEKEAAEARERNKAHRTKINGEAKNGLVASGVDAEVATLVVIAIAKGLVPHVRMEY